MRDFTEAVFSVLLYGTAPLIVGACFVLFDWLHITDTGQQVGIIIAPLLFFAWLMWRYDGFKRRPSLEENHGGDEEEGAG